MSAKYYVWHIHFDDNNILNVLLAKAQLTIIRKLNSVFIRFPITIYKPEKNMEISDAQKLTWLNMLVYPRLSYKKHKSSSS